MSTWIDCEISQRYTVRTRTDEGHKVEPNLGGKTGVCHETWESPFGMKWAKLEFEDGQISTVRTSHLVKVNDSSNDTSTPDD